MLTAYRFSLTSSANPVLEDRYVESSDASLHRKPLQIAIGSILSFGLTFYLMSHGSRDFYLMSHANRMAKPGSDLAVDTASQKVGYFLSKASANFSSNQPIPPLSRLLTILLHRRFIDVSFSISDSGDQSVDLRTSTHTTKPRKRRSSDLKHNNGI